MQSSEHRTEQSIIEGLHRRDDQALSEVYRLYGSFLTALAMRITGNPSDAEECVNDALLDLWHAVPPDRPTHLCAYVSALVRRRAIDRVRYYTAHRRAGSEYTSSTEELAECLSDPEGEDWEETLVIRDCVQRFVDNLSEDDRRIFLLRYFRFESLDSIALMCNMRQAAVGMRLMRLRQKLKRVLADNGIQV